MSAKQASLTARERIDRAACILRRVIGVPDYDLYLAHLRSSGSAPVALERTANTLFAILSRTLASGRRELELVASQDDIATPPTTFSARQLR